MQYRKVASEDVDDTERRDRGEAKRPVSKKDEHDEDQAHRAPMSPISARCRSR